MIFHTEIETEIIVKIIRILWPGFSTEMLGKIWVSFTFLNDDLV